MSPDEAKAIFDHLSLIEKKCIFTLQNTVWTPTGVELGLFEFDYPKVESSDLKDALENLTKKSLVERLEIEKLSERFRFTEEFFLAISSVELPDFLHPFQRHYEYYVSQYLSGRLAEADRMQFDLVLKRQLENIIVPF